MKTAGGRRLRWDLNGIRIRRGADAPLFKVSGFSLFLKKISELPCKCGLYSLYLLQEI